MSYEEMKLKLSFKAVSCGGKPTSGRGERALGPVVIIRIKSLTVGRLSNCASHIEMNDVHPFKVKDKVK